MTKPNKSSRVLVSVRDVADQALVSIGTVSRVLNNYPDVDDELRVRVMEAVNKLGYVHRPRVHNKTYYNQRPPQPHFDAAEPVQQEGVLEQISFCYRASIAPDIPPEMGNAYFPLVLQGVEAECRRLNINLRYRLIEDEAQELEQARKSLSNSKAEGLILVNFVDHTLVQGLLELKLPTLLVDHYFPDLAIDSVLNDSFSGTFQAIQYLIKQGHRRIAFVNGLPHFTIMRRLDAYRWALEMAGITLKPEWILEGNLMPDGGRKAAEEFIKRKLDCTAVFCSNDNTAFGFIQKITASGLCVPTDISVVGFDDIEAAAFVTPPLTTVRANAQQIGQMAVHRLVERFNNPTLPTSQTLVQTDLIKRGSVVQVRTN